jgi:hypothetical protein
MPNKLYFFFTPLSSKALVKRDLALLQFDRSPACRLPWLRAMTVTLACCSPVGSSKCLTLLQIKGYPAMRFVQIKGYPDMRFVYGLQMVRLLLRNIGNFNHIMSQNILNSTQNLRETCYLS